MSNFKFKKNREPLSDQEIEQQMNFDKFIKGHTPVSKSGFQALKGIKLVATVTSLSVVLIAAVYLVYRSGDQKAAITLPFVNPPIPSMNIPSDSFTINNTKDSILISETGSVLTIPLGAFTDEEGNDIKGPVEIRYREFHDPVDLLMSGIPMDYDSAGTHYQLESAGMFEINAFQNGKPLKLKPGKQLEVKLVSASNNPNDYNIYGLDTTAKKWDYISKNTSRNNTCIPIFERTQGITTGEITKPGTEGQPIMPQKLDPSAYNFVIDFNKNEFPELSAYKGLKFQPVDGTKKTNEELSQRTWEDVLIQKQDGDNFYTITFSTDKESHALKVIPVVDETNLVSATADFQKQQTEYLVLLKAKKERYQEQQDSLYHLKAVYTNQSLRNMNERFNNFIDGSYTGVSRDLLTYRTFAISKLGIWNSDHPFDFFTVSSVYGSASGKYKASFVTKNKDRLDLKEVVLIRREVNSLYKIVDNKYEHFPFLKGRIDVMVGISYDNKIVYLADEQLNETRPNGNAICFVMNEVSDDIKTTSQLKALLKI